ncbi:PHP domain-containing protein [Oceanobacillus alkalisoli]|uniref:PHP domain-containing protein n=1 Tax=Oceanobacillus alkalisoli TaxID=2925113 RepID=UPI001F11FCBC|nr:PHP-associated domain-containing protein [Oceanobacillus alkalisoli]MCF3944527.1 PHP domain-containing protein [Oceanobacillus alkalisoli]
MLIDFHTHANLAKKITSSLEDITTKIQEAKASGLTALAITEHFNSKNIIQLYETLYNAFPYTENYYHINGLKVFCGLEVDVKETGHFLVIGDRDDILTIARYLLPYQDQENFIAVNDLIALLANFNVLKIGGHPLRESTPWTQHPITVLSQFDAFDLNGKDLYTYGSDMEERVRSFAMQYHVPVVGGSDTHHHMQYGAIYNAFPECSTIDELRTAIQQGNYEVKISPCLNVKVKAATEIKKMIKERITV